MRAIGAAFCTAFGPTDISTVKASDHTALDTAKRVSFVATVGGPLCAAELAAFKPAVDAAI